MMFASEHARKGASATLPAASYPVVNGYWIGGEFFVVPDDDSWML